MSTTTTDQGLILPQGSDVNDVVTTLNSLVLGTGITGVESRLMKRYASVTDRTARNATPNEGEISYLQDLNRMDIYDGAAWGPAPGQRVAETLNNSSSTGSITTGETLYQSVSFTAVVGFIYEVQSEVLLQTTVSGDVCDVKMRFGTAAGTGGTQIRVGQVDCTAGSRGFQVKLTGTFTATAATCVISMTASRTVGSGTITALASTDQEQYILVKSAGHS